MIIIAGLPRSGTSWVRDIVNCSKNALIYNEPDTGNGTLFHGLPYKIVKETENGDYRNILLAQLNLVSRYSHGWKAGIIYKELARFLGFRKITTIGFKSINCHLKLGWVRKELNYPKTVYILRDPLSFCSAFLKHALKSGMKNEADVARHLKTYLKGFHPSTDTNDPGNVFNCLAIFWMFNNEFCIKENIGTESFKVVIYNQLCKEPEKEFRDIFSFLNLSFTDKVREIIKRSVTPQRNLLSRIAAQTTYATVRDPHMTLNEWKVKLDSVAKANIEAVVKGSFLIKDYNLL